MAFPIKIIVISLLLVLPFRTWGYEIRFEGNCAFSDTVLDKALEGEHAVLKENFRKTSVDDAAYMLERYYHQQGFPQARVQFRFSETPPVAVFLIEEGDETTIENVSFPGMYVLDEETVRLRLKDLCGETSAGQMRFVQSTIDSFAEEMYGFYADKAYLGARIVPEVMEKSANKREVVFHVEEGPEYTIQALRVVGDKIASDAELIGNEQRVGNIFTEKIPVLIQSRLRDYYLKQGYYKVTVDPLIQADSDTGAVIMEFHIHAGERFRIGSVGITISPEQHRSSLAVVRRRLRLKSQSYYDRQQLDFTVRRLLRTGAFQEIQLQPQPAEPGVLDIDAKLTESQAKQVSVMAGYGSWEQFRGRIGYTDSNLLGLLLRGKAEAYASYRTLGGELSIADMQWLGQDMMSQFKVFYNDREQPSFSITELGGNWSVERKWRYGHRSSFQLLHKNILDTSSRLYGVPIPPPDYSLSSIAITHRLDRRNDPLTPTKGFYLEGSVEWASSVLISDLKFLRLGGRAMYYQPLMKQTAERSRIPFAFVSTQFGTIESLGTSFDALPLQERFYNGGEGTVRSFQEDELGPKDTRGTPVGGSNYAVLTTEVQVPVYKNLYVAMFTDAGTLSTGSLFSFSDARYAIGAGLRYYTPIGSLRVDYGWNPDRRDNEKSGAFHFGFGVSF